LKVAKHTQERIMEKLALAGRKGLNITAILESLGYANETEFRQALENMTETALKKIEEIRKAIQDLKTIGETLREIDHVLAEQLRGQNRGNPNGHGNNDHSHGNGNGNGKGKDNKP